MEVRTELRPAGVACVARLTDFGAEELVVVQGGGAGARAFAADRRYMVVGIHERSPAMATTVKLHCAEAGKGTPVVLLHGFPLSGAIWHEQQRRLRDNYRVIVPDLRGHGSSPAPRGVYGMDLLARDVLALLDGLHIAKAALLGHCMGGYVTQAAWRLAPERFLALGLIASEADADTVPGRQDRHKLVEKVVAKGSSVLANAMLPRLFAPDLPAEAPIVEPVRQLILNTKLPGTVGALQGMAMRPDSGTLLSEINIPLLILAGEQDQIIPPEKAKSLAAAMKTATLTSIEHAGHLPMLEQPEATTIALRHFLSKLDS